MARKKLGNQNPTQSVILKYVKKNSKAKEAIELYERTGLSCYAWQKNLLLPLMAVDKNGLWVTLFLVVMGNLKSFIFLKFGACIRD